MDGPSQIIPTVRNVCLGATLNYPMEEIPEWKETLYFRILIIIGSFTLPINVLTVYLLISKSPFFSTEMRVLLINLQVQTSIQSAHFCFLFMPVLFPAMGGGYCAGLLCIVGQDFHIGLTQFLFCLCFVAGAFSMLIFHKNQSLLPPTSKIRVGRRLKMAIFVISHILLLSMPIIFSVSNSPLEVQQKFIDHCKFIFLTWRERNLTWGIIVLSQDSIAFNSLIFSMTANLSFFGSAACFLLIHTMWIILSHSNKNAHNTVRQRRKITNILIVFSQLIVAFFLLVLPLSLIMMQISQQIPAKAISNQLEIMSNSSQK